MLKMEKLAEKRKMEAEEKTKAECATMKKTGGQGEEEDHGSNKI